MDCILHPTNKTNPQKNRKIGNVFINFRKVVRELKSWLKRYWLPGILAIVGAATILIAIGTATIWAPPTTINTEIKTKGNVNMVATVPGLLSLYDSDVKIRVIGNGKVSLAVGNSQDTSGWLNKQPHLSVTGLASYTELKGEMVAGKEKVTALDANNATDMWQLYKTSKSTISDTWNSPREIGR